MRAVAPTRRRPEGSGCRRPTKDVEFLMSFLDRYAANALCVCTK
jgi:hypothetical protein